MTPLKQVSILLITLGILYSLSTGITSIVCINTNTCISDIFMNGLLLGTSIPVLLASLCLLLQMLFNITDRIYNVPTMILTLLASILFFTSGLTCKIVNKCSTDNYMNGLMIGVGVSNFIIVLINYVIFSLTKE